MKTFTPTVVLSFCLATTGIVQAQGDEPYNYAAHWRAWDAVAREAYIRGVVDATGSTYLLASQEWLGISRLTAKPEPANVKKVREKVFLREVESQVPSVVTDLYRDPANAYIVLIDMVYVARDKLEGKNIDAAVATARKRAIEVHRFNKKQ